MSTPRRPYSVFGDVLISLSNSSSTITDSRTLAADLNNHFMIYVKIFFVTIAEPFPPKSMSGLQCPMCLGKKDGHPLFRQYEYARKDTLIRHFESQKPDFSSGATLVSVISVYT